jgi:hypothetical protein
MADSRNVPAEDTRKLRPYQKPEMITYGKVSVLAMGTSQSTRDSPWGTLRYPIA